MKGSKRAVVIPDGFADLPIGALGGRTPMQAAATKNLDFWAPRAAQGRSFNVPSQLSPGSDVATLSLLGYDPLIGYTGRAPIEAAAQGIELGPEDWAFRCNLVCLENDVMKDFTAGHISTEDATAILDEIQREVAPRWNEIAPNLGGTVEFKPGVSYRNLAIFRPERGRPFPFDKTTKTVPPHDYSDRSIAEVYPRGAGAAEVRALMAQCAEFLRTSETNAARVARGELPATDCWLWGQGGSLTLAPFAEKFHWGAGAMITAVDLLRGIARNIGWDVIDVPGATGYVDTNYAAKGEYAAAALDDYDIVVVHVEAPDEMGHEGDYDRKRYSLEQIDAQTLPPILDKLQSYDDWRLLISPDHPTPVSTKTHSREFVPWAIVGSDVKGDGFPTYDEGTGEQAKRFYPQGHNLMNLFLRGDLQ
ncbi:MAG: cofactor-independent phosphoglycerate mutase [Thermoguttaceae bacterium]|jgi:2,3-bisphosphoglycerate-independent phosphoglycerate mutase